MTTIKAFIKSHPVLAYFVLTFAISWGGVLLVIGGPDAIPGAPEQFETLLPLVIPVLLGGPSAAGLLLTGLVAGRAGFRELLSRLLKWRVGARWYAVALLTAPLVFVAVQSVLSLGSPVYRLGILATSDKTAFLLSGMAAALMVGVLEELGWTGFAIPRLKLRYGVFGTGLIVGVLWGGWHLLGNDFWAATAISGQLPLTLFVIVRGLGLVFGGLAAFRILMVWVYDRTESLLLAMLMHVSLTGCTFILGPPAVSGMSLLTYDLALNAAQWAVVGVVALASGGKLVRQLLPSTAA